MYQAFITWLIFFFFFFSLFRHEKIFVNMLFYYFFAIIILFNNCCNTFIDWIFSSVKNKWLAKFIINTYNFVIKTARNMILIFFSIWSNIFSLLLLTPFKIEIFKIFDIDIMRLIFICFHQQIQNFNLIYEQANPSYFNSKID